VVAGIWSIVFPSPAHHHVHHSCHPEHIDKNFAFVFPVWDLIFGTYFMPDDNRDVKFGVTEGDHSRALLGAISRYVSTVDRKEKKAAPIRVVGRKRRVTCRINQSGLFGDSAIQVD